MSSPEDSRAQLFVRPPMRDSPPHPTPATAAASSFTSATPASPNCAGMSRNNPIRPHHSPAPAHSAPGSLSELGARPGAAGSPQTLQSTKASGAAHGCSGSFGWGSLTETGTDARSARFSFSREMNSMSTVAGSPDGGRLAGMGFPPPPLSHESLCFVPAVAGGTGSGSGVFPPALDASMSLSFSPYRRAITSTPVEEVGRNRRQASTPAIPPLPKFLPGTGPSSVQGTAQLATSSVLDASSVVQPTSGLANSQWFVVTTDGKSFLAVDQQTLMGNQQHVQGQGVNIIGPESSNAGEIGLSTVLQGPQQLFQLQPHTHGNVHPASTALPSFPHAYPARGDDLWQVRPTAHHLSPRPTQMPTHFSQPPTAQTAAPPASSASSLSQLAPVSSFLHSSPVSRLPVRMASQVPLGPECLPPGSSLNIPRMPGNPGSGQGASAPNSGPAEAFACGPAPPETLSGRVDGKYEVEPYNSHTLANLKISSLDRVVCAVHRKERSAQNMVYVHDRETQEVFWRCKTSSQCKTPREEGSLSCSHNHTHSGAGPPHGDSAVSGGGRAAAAASASAPPLAALSTFQAPPWRAAQGDRAISHDASGSWAMASSMPAASLPLRAVNSFNSSRNLSHSSSHSQSNDVNFGTSADSQNMSAFRYVNTMLATPPSSSSPGDLLSFIQLQGALTSSSQQQQRSALEASGSQHRSHPQAMAPQTPPTGLGNRSVGVVSAMSVSGRGSTQAFNSPFSSSTPVVNVVAPAVFHSQHQQQQQHVQGHAHHFDPHMSPR